jgi:hypothetical protein
LKCRGFAGTKLAGAKAVNAFPIEAAVTGFIMVEDCKTAIDAGGGLVQLDYET